jgi:hypothetical protein
MVMEKRMSDLNQRAAQWVASRDTGLSSMCLWATMMGVKPRDISHPRDGADLGRCVRLLEAIPEWRVRLGEMASVSPYWAALVPEWDRLAEILAQETAGTGIKGSTYKAMRELFDPIEAQDRSIIRLGNGDAMSFGA